MGWETILALAAAALEEMAKQRAERAEVEWRTSVASKLDSIQNEMREIAKRIEDLFPFIRIAQMDQHKFVTAEDVFAKRRNLERILSDLSDVRDLTDVERTRVTLLSSLLLEQSTKLFADEIYGFGVYDNQIATGLTLLHCAARITEARKGLEPYLEDLVKYLSRAQTAFLAAIEDNTKERNAANEYIAQFADAKPRLVKAVTETARGRREEPSVQVTTYYTVIITRKTDEKLEFESGPNDNNFPEFPGLNGKLEGPTGTVEERMNDVKQHLLTCPLLAYHCKLEKPDVGRLTDSLVD